MTWDILIATIEHRHEQLKRLLDVLVPQLIPGVQIIVYRDNLEATIGCKRQRLLEASEADYVSFCDDDDMVPPHYVARIAEALAEEPDYVGWEQQYTIDGVQQRRVFHSLHHGCQWRGDEGGLYRGITHFNQTRRELALLSRFDNELGAGEDYTWAVGLHATGKVVTEVYIDEPMHHHQESSTDCFHTPRTPLDDHPPVLTYPSVRYLDAAS